MSMADQFDPFDEDEMANLEDESAEYALDPLWVDACPDDICNNQGWCRHRYKADPREGR